MTEKKKSGVSFGRRPNWLRKESISPQKGEGVKKLSEKKRWRNKQRKPRLSFSSSFFPSSPETSSFQTWRMFSLIKQSLNFSLSPPLLILSLISQSHLLIILTLPRHPRRHPPHRRPSPQWKGPHVFCVKASLFGKRRNESTWLVPQIHCERRRSFENWRLWKKRLHDHFLNDERGESQSRRWSLHPLLECQLVHWMIIIYVSHTKWKACPQDSMHLTLIYNRVVRRWIQESKIERKRGRRKRPQISSQWDGCLIGSRSHQHQSWKNLYWCGAHTNGKSVVAIFGSRFSQSATEAEFLGPTWNEMMRLKLRRSRFRRRL